MGRTGRTHHLAEDPHGDVAEEPAAGDEVEAEEEADEVADDGEEEADDGLEADVERGRQVAQEGQRE